MKKNDYLLYFFMLFLLLLSPLPYTRKINEYLVHLSFVIPFYLYGISGFEIINLKMRIKWEKACKTELELEDNVLLQGVGLFQSVFFIYLSLSEDLLNKNHNLNFLKWTIPIFIVIFYMIRGYGHIKNNALCRKISSFILIYFVIIEMVVLINLFITKSFTIKYNEYDLVDLYFTYITSFTFGSFIIKIKNALSNRYDI